MIQIDLNEIAITELISIEQSNNKPSYFPLCASYIRAFPLNRHTATSDDMPMDKRLTHAVRKMYRNATPEEKAVMTRTEYNGMTTRERSKVFNRLVYRLARLAGLTAYTLDTTNETKERTENT